MALRHIGLILILACLPGDSLAMPTPYCYVGLLIYLHVLLQTAEARDVISALKAGFSNCFLSRLHGSKTV